MRSVFPIFFPGRCERPVFLVGCGFDSRCTENESHDLLLSHFRVRICVRFFLTVRQSRIKYKIFSINLLLYLYNIKEKFIEDV